jgi:hypothetical protein
MRSKPRRSNPVNKDDDDSDKVKDEPVSAIEI